MVEAGLHFSDWEYSWDLQVLILQVFCISGVHYSLAPTFTVWAENPHCILILTFITLTFSFKLDLNMRVAPDGLLYPRF